MKLLNLIYCDSLRQEINNKVTLVGCYSERLLITIAKENQWPINLPLAIYARVERENGDGKIISCGVEISDAEGPLTSIEAPIQSGADQTRPMILGFGVQIPFRHAGPIKTQLMLRDEAGRKYLLEGPGGFALETVIAEATTPPSSQ